MTSVKKGQEPIQDEVRDKIFSSIRHTNENNICIDCGKKNPKWTSVYLGIHLCIDCAGKHRQYGVIYSFVKSANLDKWNHRQILYMQKGSNGRALEYFRKYGIMSNGNRNIDYRSAVAQKYKAILTEEVEIEINGAPFTKVQENKQKENNSNVSMSQQAIDMFKEEEKSEGQKQIPNAEVVTKVEAETEKPKKGKKGKKKMGNQIDIDFENMTFDDGVSKQEKQRIVKSYENTAPVQNEQTADGESKSNTGVSAPTPVQEQKPVVKELSEEEVAQKMQSIKAQNNVKSISSDQFKDDSVDNVAIKQKFNQFEGAKSISSSSFNNEHDTTEDETAVDKLKEIGGKLYEKFSGYWGK